MSSLERKDFSALSMDLDAIPLQETEDGKQLDRSSEEYKKYRDRSERLATQIANQLLHAPDYQSFTAAQIKIAADSIVGNLLAMVREYEREAGVKAKAAIQVTEVNPNDLDPKTDPDRWIGNQGDVVEMVSELSDKPSKQKRRYNSVPKHLRRPKDAPPAVRLSEFTPSAKSNKELQVELLKRQLAELEGK